MQRNFTFKKLSLWKRAPARECLRKGKLSTPASTSNHPLATKAASQNLSSKNGNTRPVPQAHTDTDLDASDRCCTKVGFAVCTGQQVACTVHIAELNPQKVQLQSMSKASFRAEQLLGDSYRSSDRGGSVQILAYLRWYWSCQKPSSNYPRSNRNLRVLNTNNCSTRQLRTFGRDDCMRLIKGHR